ncbi:MAG: ABC transporter substrate-binding protein [Lachnospiraceae bacterium]|nr:ABC transporter substrate-binding protein [Lachnospiraceae bacterium]
MKKLLAGILAATMMVSLCACGAKPAETPASKTETAQTETKTETSTEATTESGATSIVVYRACFNNGNPDSAKTKEIETAINDYIKDKINVQITLFDVGSGEYQEKANLALNNNEINLLWTAAWEDTIGTKQLYAKKAAYDITDLLPGTDLYNSMDANQWEGTKYGGRNYYVPVYKDNVEGYNLMFRQALVDQFGWDLSSVKGLADIEPMLADAKGEGLPYPFLLQKTAMFYRFYIDSFDFFTGDANGDFVAVDRDTNEVVDTILEPEYLEYCKLMAKWSALGYISEDEAAKQTTDTTTQTQDWAVSWWTDVPNNDEADGRYGQDVTMVKCTKNYMHTDSALGSCFAITANSTEEQAKACIDFLGLLYTDKALADLYTYGVEGTDFTYDADGYVVKNDSPYNHSMWESASATVVTAEASSPYTPQMYKDFNGSAVVSCASGFQFDKEPVKDKYTACQNVFEEYGFMLETGYFAEDEVEAKLAEYQEKLDEAGYQDVLSTFQEQYNEWKKAN